MSFYSVTNGLSNNNVWALHEDKDGVLWIGTERGLNRLKNGPRRACFSLAPARQLCRSSPCSAGEFTVGDWVSRVASTNWRPNRRWLTSAVGSPGTCMTKSDPNVEAGHFSGGGEFWDAACGSGRGEGRRARSRGSPGPAQPG
ncbi:MAG: hypothetical protein FJ398_22150 [Verrucomicrobia bacterium]|nr:hypothetical protein [Verrucomicrobiota bacterium]